MKRLNELVNDGILEPEMSEYLEKKMVFQSRLAIKGRQTIYVGEPLGYEWEEFGFEVGTEVADAYLAMEVDIGGGDVVDMTKSTVTLWVQQRPFKIPGRKLAASRRYGLPLDTASLSSATYKTNRLEDETIIQGHTPDGGTTYDISGIYQSAGKSYTTSKDYDTAGNPLDAVTGTRALTEDWWSGGYNLLLNSTQRGQLAGNVISGVGREEAEVLEILDGGAIIQTDKITAGTGLLSPVPNEAVAKYVLATDYVVLGRQKSPYEVFEGVVFVAGGPAVYEPNAFGTQTNI